MYTVLLTFGDLKDSGYVYHKGDKYPREGYTPEKALFPGSLKVEEKDGKFYCPVRDANIDTPNAVCNICLAEQLDF